uniref:hypothetical protein n=1 Tax=Faecalibaculum rodentium TaxID=1702221 RepID=UPI002632032F
MKKDRSASGGPVFFYEMCEMGECLQALQKPENGFCKTIREPFESCKNLQYYSSYNIDERRTYADTDRRRTAGDVC